MTSASTLAKSLRGLRAALKGQHGSQSRIDVVGRSNVVIGTNNGAPGSTHKASSSQYAPIVQARRDRN